MEITESIFRTTTSKSLAGGLEQAALGQTVATARITAKQPENNLTNQRIAAI